MLSKRTSYHDLGADYIDKRSHDVLKKRLIHKLETLGLKVTVEQLPMAA